jgi:hypothetical protein
VGKIDLFEAFDRLTTQPAQAGFAILAETKRSLSPVAEAMR